jgi:hypothetical protein
MNSAPVKSSVVESIAKCSAALQDCAVELFMSSPRDPERRGERKLPSRSSTGGAGGIWIGLIHICSPTMRFRAVFSLRRDCGCW